MVKAVAQLEQELAVLDQTVAAIARAFHEAYQQYLKALGAATRQQLILASYHICTRGYPDQFLALPLPDRQTLQQTLRQLAQQAETELIGCLTPVISAKPNWALLPGQKNPFDFEPDLEAAQQPDAALADPEPFDASAEGSPFPQPENPQPSEWGSSQEQPSEAFQSSSLADSPADSSADSSAEPAPSVEQDGEAAASPTDANHPLANLLLSERLAARLGRATAASPRSSNPLHPKQIAQWQSQLEDEIVEVLQNISHATNQVLQQTGILPNRLPEPILEVAAKADLSSETTASPPNLLNLLVEADAEDEKSALTQVIAVRLRLAEIEFGDAATAAQRSRLRHLTAQLVKLGREYQRKQKERAVAQAEAAWRSSWQESV
jgi:hypothetical protein